MLCAYLLGVQKRAHGGDGGGCCQGEGGGCCQGEGGGYEQEGIFCAETVWGGGSQAANTAGEDAVGSGANCGVGGEGVVLEVRCEGIALVMK